MYGQTLVSLGYDAMARGRLIQGFAREIEQFAPHYLEEMRGIAAGAGVTFEDVVMINARTEVIAKARAEKKKAAELEPGDGCTGALILPSRSANGRLIHGQNWDWRAECADTAIVLRVRNDNGPDILTFVEAGGLARSGLNGAGISITANYLESDRDFQQLGVPLSLIRRKVLEQEHFALAIKAVSTTPKSCSNNIMLGMAAGFGVDYECTTDEAFPIYPGADDLIVHANHWVSEVALGKLRDTGRASTPESAYRDWRVRRLLNEAATLTREDLARVVRRLRRAVFRVPPAAPRQPRQSVGHGGDGGDGTRRRTDGGGPAARAEPRLHALQPAGRTPAAARRPNAATIGNPPMKTILSSAALAVSLALAGTAQAAAPLRISLTADIRSTEPGVNRDSNSDAVVLHIVEGLVAYGEDAEVRPAGAVGGHQPRRHDLHLHAA